jgi:ADP-ribosyl-[dinitrogen reductase] hydrolase
MPAMTTPSAADRCRGLLLGLVAGDKNGGPMCMAMHVAESLRDRRRFDPADILQRYVDWWKAGAFDTGPVSDRALELIATAMPVPEATALVHREFSGKTAGCNPAHRSAPLSMLEAIADDDLAACATAEARLTHHDPRAGEIAAAVNRLCRMLIRGVVWDDARRPFAGFTDQEGPGNNGGFAPDVLRAAVHFVGTSANCAEALKRSLAFAGPANYCPVLAGTIAGARWGASSIPHAALAHVGILAGVQETAEALTARWGITSD